MQGSAKLSSIDQLWKSASDAVRWPLLQSWLEPAMSPRFRLLRHLRARLEAPESNQAQSANKEREKTKAACPMVHMAIQTAIGFLLGVRRTFSTENDAIAYLLIAMYPRFPTDTNDHRCHCQAFRHLYVLASRERLLTTVDVESKTQTSAPVEIGVFVDANRTKYKPSKRLRHVWHPIRKLSGKSASPQRIFGQCRGRLEVKM